MDEEDNKVSSELYNEYKYETQLKPTYDNKNVVSKFWYYIPKSPITDQDGDLNVYRRRSKEDYNEVIEIEHSKSTLLNLVGLQVWRGSLLLADWLIYNGKNLQGKKIFEVASGVGLTSIVASFFKPVICTDINVGGILDLIKCNVERNKMVVKNAIDVKELDFMADISENIRCALSDVEIILAADVVYDNRLTEAFIKATKELLSVPPRRSIYIALEKRYVFTVSDLDTCAPCYEYFLECLATLKEFEAIELTIDFPQYFQYDRVKELVLWKVSNKF